MWLTPRRSSTSSVRSATSWLTRDRDAAPKIVRVLSCPVRPKTSEWMDISKGYPLDDEVSARAKDRFGYRAKLEREPELQHHGIARRRRGRQGCARGARGTDAQLQPAPRPGRAGSAGALVEGRRAR